MTDNETLSIILKFASGILVTGASGITAMWLFVRARFKELEKKTTECEEDREKLWKAIGENALAKEQIENCPARACPWSDAKQERKKDEPPPHGHGLVTV